METEEMTEEMEGAIIEIEEGMEPDIEVKEGIEEAHLQGLEQEIDYWSKTFPLEHRGKILRITSELLGKLLTPTLIDQGMEL